MAYLTIILFIASLVVTTGARPATDFTHGRYGRYGPPKQRRQRLGQSLGALEGAIGINNTFDYVVVGGGTAGLAIANRLSESGQHQVAIIEAGTFYQVTDPLLAQTPAGDVVFVGASAADEDPLVDWSFYTTPQAGANNRVVHYTRGKCLGGSSARNFMIYQRGTYGSMQQWANQVGDESFTFPNVLPYYQKSCAFTPPNTEKREANASVEYDASMVLLLFLCGFEPCLWAIVASVLA